LARVAAAVIVALFALGAIWYGFSPEVFGRLWQDIFDRPSGPMAFRFLLQPAMASILAIRDGIKDARLGRSPYLRTILSDPEMRWPRVWEGLIATGRVVLLGLAVDAIYQHRMLGTLYPGEAAVVALLLAFLPYLLIRGVAARVACRWSRPDSPTAR
jgi:hypothetical protein